MPKMELTKLLQEMEAFAEAEHVPILNSKARELFCTTVKEAQPRRLLEIGTAIGYSALLALSNTAADARLVTLELSEDRAKLARKYWSDSPYEEQITLLQGDAGEILSELTGPFDFVFIDAAKGQYPDYWRKLQPLLAADAVVVADNVLFRGYVRGEKEAPRRFRTITKRLREYIALVEADNRFVTEIHADGDGLAVSKRRKDFAET